MDLHHTTFLSVYRHEDWFCVSTCFLSKEGMKRYLMKGNRGQEEVMKPGGWWVAKGGTAEGAEEEETKDDGWSPLCCGGWVSEERERERNRETQREREREF